MDLDSFSFFCVGLECDTEDEAWSTWKAEARTYFKWIKGKKIWRTLPEVFKQQIFSENKTVYIVKARVIALDELPDGFFEAEIDGPYKTNQKDFTEEALALKI